MNFKLITLIYPILVGSLIQCNSPKKSKDVKFLQKTPIIDGKLDTDLNYLDKNEFNFIWQFDNPATDTVPVNYRMGYTPTHFYLYIETDSDSINYRRRGFLNGDGFKLLFAKPQKDSLTNEFYDMAFSPSKDKDYWARQIIWEYNRKQGSKKFSSKTLSQESVSNGKSGFEALIAWKDIEPYHPWFLDKIGYNLYFAKAIGDTITNGYAVVKDEGIWDEEIPKRNYKLLSFEKPKKVAREYFFAKPKNRNLKVSEDLVLETIAISNKQISKKIKVEITNDVNEVFYKEVFNILIDKKLVRDSFKLKIGILKPVKYKLIISSLNDTLTNTEIVIFPKINFELITSKLQSNQYRINSGTVNTLLFKLNQVRKKINELQPYENGKETLNYLVNFNQEYIVFNKGVDPYDKLKGPYRRAFKSKYDNSYQPYSIKLPKNYDPTKKYPLLVFLHGSGQDEQELLKSPRSDGSFIELAPLARDIYYAYALDNSQKDIVEAIADVSLHFSVDKNKIIIGGFSMGGYGALRTFYEHPELYKGVAVFAGHPNLASEWLEAEHPNFLKDSYLTSFTNVPIFIYHGTNDGSLPVNLIEKMNLKLLNAGAIVTKSIVEGRGHQYPDKKTNNIYFNWLSNVINNGAQIKSK